MSKLVKQITTMGRPRPNIFDTDQNKRGGIAKSSYYPSIKNHSKNIWDTYDAVDKTITCRCLSIYD